MVHRCAVLALLLAPASGKIVDGVVKLSSQDTEMYVTKFSFSPSVYSTINGTFHTDEREYFDNHPHSLMLCLYDDVAWPKFQTACAPAACGTCTCVHTYMRLSLCAPVSLPRMTKGSLCVDRQRLASWSTKIVPKYSNEPGKTPRHDFSFAATLKMPSRHAHYWFGMLMDCYLEEYDAHPPPMQYALLFMNGDSQLPADEDGMRHINVFILVAMALYGAVYFYNLYERWTRLKQGHLITLIFMLAYFLQALSVLCEVWHLSRFTKDGKGLRWRHTWFALDFVSAVAQGASELIISFVLIALAFGWTLGLQSQEPVSGALGKLLAGFQRPGQLLRGLRSPAAVLLLVLAFVQVVLLARGRAFEEDFNNFHDFEHWPGMALIGMRVALCALFVYALYRSFRLERQKEASAPMQREVYLASPPAAGAVQVHEHKRFLTVLPDDDSLAIANNSGNNIQIISANGALRRNLGSRGDAPGQFLGPAGLACDGQAIYVTDWCHRVQKLKLDGTSLATACEYGSGEGQLCFPTGAALAGGILFVADTLNNRVVRFDAESLKWLSTFGGEGRAEGQFLGPHGLASTEDEVFVVDGHGQRIQVFNLKGEFVRTFGSWGTEPGQFDGPRGIAVANGHLYVAELGTALGGGGRVQELSLDGRPLQVLESPAGSPLYGVCVVSRQDCTPNNSSALYVTGADDSKLHVFIAANGGAMQPQR